MVSLVTGIGALS